MWSGGCSREGRRVLANAGSVIVLVSVLAIGLRGGCALASDEKTKTDEKAKTQEIPKTEAKPLAAKPATKENYPLDICIVSGNKLGAMGEPVLYNYRGREVRFCCSGCISRFEKDPKTYLKKMDEAIIAKELPIYPLDTCVVTGAKLGANKEGPVNYIYDNHLVRFCCAGCQKTFDKDPEKYLLKLDQARQERAQQKAAEDHTLPAPTEDKGSCAGQ